MNLGIIILNYNGWEDTMECLQSLMKTTYKDKCILVIDNCSTNDSYNKLIRYGNKEWKYDFNILSNENEIIDLKENQLLIYKAANNMGFAGGNNFGIKFFKKNITEHIMLLNNDTTVSISFIEPLLIKINNSQTNIMLTSKIIDYYNPSNYIVGGKINYFKASGYHMRRNKNRKCTFISGCIWLFKVNLVDYAGYLNEKYFLYVEDVEFCFRLNKLKIPVECIEESIIYHKEGKSTSKKILNYYYNTRNRLYLAEEYLKGWHKIIFYIFFISSRLLILLKKPCACMYIWKGYRDFKQNIGGIYK